MNFIILINTLASISFSSTLSLPPNSFPLLSVYGQPLDDGLLQFLSMVLSLRNEAVSRIGVLGFLHRLLSASRLAVQSTVYCVLIRDVFLLAIPTRSRMAHNLKDGTQFAGWHTNCRMTNNLPEPSITLWCKSLGRFLKDFRASIIDVFFFPRRKFAL